jgi:hypothetical protein
VLWKTVAMKLLTDGEKWLQSAHKVAWKVNRARQGLVLWRIFEDFGKWPKNEFERE